ncbi:hypothetical protein BBP40_011083 [Aspergillus hancockii]|nr:hypothetical protein BBP40_011083 [Aspergillus hancockii]
MLENHPFLAHPHPPPYEDIYGTGHGKPSKCKSKMHKEGQGTKGMKDDDGCPRKFNFGFGHRGGRGGRAFGRHHPQDWDSDVTSGPASTITINEAVQVPTPTPGECSTFTAEEDQAGEGSSKV